MPRKGNQYMEVLFAWTFASLKLEGKANIGVSLGVQRGLDKQSPLAAVRGRTFVRRRKLLTAGQIILIRYAEQLQNAIRRIKRTLAGMKGGSSPLRIT
ncbi:hypothetical protein [Dongshaea marina]|uniref:hypothetical protein n=1 Tax=Dongshaea marina TaxID=2047966 RepID=UPI000D3E7B27|nr:hypothetical protein [Dongshaea marina]